MAIEVIMPKLGAMVDGTLQTLLRREGEDVGRGEPLFEIETDKVVQEVESPGAGIVAAWLFEESDVVECGRVVAVIAEAGEDPNEVATRYRDGRDGVRQSTAPAAERARPSPEVRAHEGRRPVSPLAKKRAAELGVRLEDVSGTGPGGRITREDVERAAAAAPSGGERAEGEHRIPLRGMRRTIAERMHRSLAQTAQLTITTEADVTPAVELRERIKERAGVTFTDIVIRAAARALVAHPLLSARLEGDEIVFSAAVNVGIAVSLDGGLVVPVIRGADRLGLEEIAARRSALAAKARSGTLGHDDVTGGTFSVTNLGSYGVDFFTPIVVPGQTAILGVGRVVEKPAIHAGRVVPRWLLSLSLTFDHRVVDGVPAARMLHEVVERINDSEAPER